MSHVTCVLTAHDEGSMTPVSARSLLQAVEVAAAAGLACEVVLMLDRPTDATRRALTSFIRDARPTVIETDHGDQGLVRNDAVAAASGAYIAFLDGDDLWSGNWLVAAHAVCHADPGRVIAHPEINWFFEGQATALFPPDMRDPDFDLSLLRCENVYDALCMAPAEVYRLHPFGQRDIKGGFAFEDWHWACETVDAGYLHHVAQSTIIFKRRRAASRNIEATTNKVTLRDTPLMRLGWQPSLAASAITP